MTRLGRALAAGGIAAGTVIAVVACYAPTEVRLEITTDRPCVGPRVVSDPDPNAGKRRGRTWISVGPSAAEASLQAETEDCVASASGGGDIGSLVLVPSGERDARATVQVTMTVDGSDPGQCQADRRGVLPEQCIVARRTFAFIAHTSRTIPIRLYDACRGVVCADDQTCDELGMCQFADIDLRCEGCDAGAPPRDAGAEAAAETGATDAAVVDGAVADASPCIAHPRLGVSGCSSAAPYSLWIFHEASGGVVPDVSGRGCTPLQNVGTSTSAQGGIELAAGKLSTLPGVASGLISAINTSGAVTLEIWARTTRTPVATTDIGAILGPTSHASIAQTPTGTQGTLDGYGFILGSSTRSLPTGKDEHLLVRNNGSTTAFSLGATSLSAGDVLALPWNAAAGQVVFGPWDGVVVRAAVYDRDLTLAEIACLRAAGSIAIP